MFIAKLTPDSEAFHDSDGNPAPEMEIARILRQAADDIENHLPRRMDLRDYNGNKVGEIKWTP